jgi:ATP-binding cassette subfamily B protein
MAHTLYIANLREFLEVRPRHQPVSGKVSENPKGEIEFRNVSFGYPGAASATLSNLSFHIMPGETIAIVGKNGAGKSTLVKLIARFYDPDIGNVLYDGIDLREISLDFLYRHTAFVFQGFAAYEASVADNIAYGDHNRLLNNRREVERIAQYTGADKLIKKMPHGYETLLGRVFGEYDLSTGQWQQIAIARAFARQNANLLILDEPTASLDVQAEYELFERFRTLARGKTTILVSHRFSTVALADRIFVLEEGRLVEQGTHSELLARGGHYASLYEIQGRARKSLRENSTGAV